MTLVEFLAPLLRGSYRHQCLGVMYFEHRYRRLDKMTAAQVLAGLRAARVPKIKRMNVPDIPAKAGANVEIVGREGGRIYWRLTETGEATVRELLDLPEPQPDVEVAVGALSQLADSMKDDGSRDYVNEAIKCLRAGALRATVVFLWAGAIRSLQQDAIDDLGLLNTAIQKHDQKARSLKRVDDFAYVRDSIQLMAFKDIGLIDKSEHDVLAEGLDLRNRCAHPMKYKPQEKRVSGFVEDVMGIAF